ncbi:TadE/TadG family type IV pilus assembly protein [Thalassovita mangrovi]|uniref:TadE-like domain-containing protein n=1 Tax=Thalassovita mangrovi TaxID=2692236 RepID=A0A6L8LGY5_9RHOB|nr:TadE family protein [Thalassovita mangrovi]MYM54256.1 hypothetical protein [Thalassovita mangrovi]
MRAAAPYRDLCARGAAFLRRFARDSDGSSVVEFALLAPIMLMITLATFDLGNSVSDRMAMDAALRNGLQVAMSTGSVDATLSMMQTTAEAELGADQASFQVSRICTCGTVYDSQVACDTICTGSSPSTSVFMELAGSYDHSGWILPDITLNPTVFLRQR